MTTYIDYEIVEMTSNTDSVTFKVKYNGHFKTFKFFNSQIDDGSFVFIIESALAKELVNEDIEVDLDLIETDYVGQTSSYSAQSYIDPSDPDADKYIYLQKYPKFKIVFKTENSDIEIIDDIILCDASEGSFNITLPTAVGNKGKHFRLKKIDSTDNMITVKCQSGETIDTMPTKTLDKELNYILVVSDDTNWFIASAASTEAANHSNLTNLSADDHPQYHSDVRGDNRYYKKTELNEGQLDNRYFTESETNTALAGKSNTSHTHDTLLTSEQKTDLTDGGETSLHTHSGIGFPAPDYDSGWVNINKGEFKELTHNLGGDPDNYFVDLSFKSPTYKIHNIYYGQLHHPSLGSLGLDYRKLDNNSIEVWRGTNDGVTTQFRIRIWKY